MEVKTKYGILFNAEVIDDKNMLLNPCYIIDGTVNYNDVILDKYEKTYKKIYMTTNNKDYDTLYGFGIDEEALLGYFKDKGYPSSQADYPEICANFYLELAKKYVFILEKTTDDKKFTCYAIDLKTKKTKIVDINKDLVHQLEPELDTSKQEKLNNANHHSKTKKYYNPETVLGRVTKRVIGQNEAAYQLVGTICKNLKYGNFEGMKSNILLYGPSGCGKTELMRSIHQELGVPVIVEDITNYTANGYVGDSVKKILRRLFVSCNCDIDKVEKAVVFLDEFDKLASTSSNATVNKTDVQEELLKMIEGGMVDINDSNRTNQQLYIDTSNITFVLGGAFSKLLEKKKSNPIGFNETSKEEPVVELGNKELISYGIISEIAGRLQVKIPIRKLEIDDLENLLMNSSVSCLKIYEKALLARDKVKIVYENKREFVRKVAMKASTLDSGARALKTVIDETFLPATYEISKTYPQSRELLVSADTIDNPKQYVLKKVRRDNYELPTSVGRRDQCYKQ